MASPATASAPASKTAPKSKPSRLRSIIIKLLRGDAAEQRSTLPESRLPLARVDIDAGCITVVVNPAHWREFGSQRLADPTGTRCHCDQIRTMDTLDPQHCILNRLRDAAKASGRPRTGIEFAQLRQDESARTYQIYLATVTLEEATSPNLVLVELERISDVALRISSPDATTDSRTMEMSLLHADRVVQRWNGTVDQAQIPTYFEFDRRLEHAEHIIASTGMDAALSFLRDWALESRHDKGYPLLALLDKLCGQADGPQDLMVRVSSLRARLFDGPIVAQYYDQIDELTQNALKHQPLSADTTSAASRVADFGTSMAASEPGDAVDCAHGRCAPDQLEAARQAVIKNPDDVEFRHTFARILRAMGKQEQAAFVEQQLRPEGTTPGVREQRAILEELAAERKHGQAWSGFADLALPEGVQWEYRRGFVEHLICPMDAILDPRLQRVLQRAPIRHLTLRKGKSLPPPLPAYFTNLRSLALDSCDITDAFLADFFAATWEHLVWLSLAYNPITAEGIDTLASATRDQFPLLQYVNLLGCKADPREELFFDHNVLTGSRLPEQGIALEQRYGKIPWLYLTADGKLNETNRYRLAEATANLLICK